MLLAEDLTSACAIGGLHGQWEVENHGIAPDIEVWPAFTKHFAS